MVLDDGTDKTIIDTYSEGDGLNVSIYSVTELEHGIHTVKIVNEPKMTNITGRTGE